MHSYFHTKAITRAACALLLLGLMSCGGRASLEETQTVAEVDAPDVPENSVVEILWRASSTGSKTNAINFDPQVEGETIFLANHGGKIQGFALASGEREFKADVDTNLVSGVGVNISSVIAATTSGEIIALDRDKGDEKWRYSINRSISAKPSVNDQYVVIRTIDGKVVGLNAQSGEKVWGFERPVASLSVGLDSPSLIAGEGVITGFSSGRIMANSLYNGTIFWEKRAFRPAGKNEIDRLIDIDARPALAGQTAIVGAMQGGLIAYRLKNGEELWRNEDVGTRKTITVWNELVAITEPQSVITMLNIGSGEQLWQQSELRGHGLTAPVIYDEGVVVGGLEGDVYFLDKENGNIKSQFHLFSSPITALHKTKQGVVAYSAASGKLVSISF